MKIPTFNLLAIIILFSNSVLKGYAIGYDSDAITMVRAEINVAKGAVLTDLMKKGIENTHYIIRNEHDLSQYPEGLTIGENCVLEFKRGGLKNGKIKCSSISIEGKPKFIDAYIEISNAKNIKIKDVYSTFSYGSRSW